MTEIREPAPGTASRRAVVGGIAGIGVGVPLVAACGSDSGGGSSSSDSGGSGGSGSSTTSSGPVGTTSEVPVGGGKIFKAEKVVVTQPTQGEFKAFSAVCTHQQCVVTGIEGKNIDCSCHGSQFSTADGSVVSGPATKPLAELKVSVAGKVISVS